MRLSLSLIIFVLLEYTIAVLNKDEMTNKELNYDCGHVKFQNEAVKNALEAALKKNEKNKFKFKFPKLYNGPLYDSSLKYIIWPILASGETYSSYLSRGTFYLVIDPSNNVVDIIAVLSDNQMIKCQRQSIPSSESSGNVPDTNNGYDCGHEFFEDQLIFNNLNLACSRVGSNHQYPSLYTGNLFDYKEQYYIWPISKKDLAVSFGRFVSSTYHIIFTSDCTIQGVIARLKQVKSFIKCQRGMEPRRTLPDPDEGLDLSIQSGYQCGVIFFERSYLEKSIESSLIPTRFNKIKKFPERFSGSMFNEDVLIWPIFPKKNIYHSGFPGKYYLVMNQKYKLISVIIKNVNSVEQCTERFKQLENSQPETDDFQCGMTVFKISWIEKAAEIACSKLLRQDLIYPAVYKGPDFDISGPYYTYPIHPTKTYVKSISPQPQLILQYYSLLASLSKPPLPSPINSLTSTAIDPNEFRLIINIDCQVAGVIYFKNTEFFKCKRRKDGTIPGEESLERIREVFNS